MFPALKSILHALKARHERRIAIRALAAMDDHQLSDIGIERGSVVDAVDGNLPQFMAWARS